MNTTTVDGMDISGGGVPDETTRLAAEGRLSKTSLAALLPVEKRQTFLNACSQIERQYTEQCAGKHDPCLESGCAVLGEVCLQPLLRAEAEYQRACGAVWLELRG